MEPYLRRYILCHGYAIGLGAFIVGPFTVAFSALGLTSSSHLAFYTWVYMIGHWAWLLGVLWILSGASFLFGIVKKRNPALYPLLLLIGVQLLLILVGDVFMALDQENTWNLSWNFTPFLDVAQFANIKYVILHMGFTIVVLGKLIDEHSRKSSWSGTNMEVYCTTIVND
nr:uncharacterized protein LOC115265346 [Aedes albopictus]